ncbi:MAG: hypothetical protein P1P90_05310 [Patescibacteria group bacterium]|nr:hypothetical protein [Patescibacteria group bacterium]
MKKPFYLFILGFALIGLAAGCVEYEVIGDIEGEPNQLDSEPVVIGNTAEPQNTTSTQTSTSTEPAIIGGDLDSHGCLVGAGYQYCPSKEQCVRVWETGCDEISESGLTQIFANDDEDLAAKGSIDYISASDHYKQNNGSQIYIAKLKSLDCTGCYDVTVNYKANVDDKVMRMTAELTMEDWNIENISLEETPIQDRTANECIDADGRVVDTAEDGACKFQEAYIGNITDRERSNICCK